MLDHSVPTAVQTRTAAALGNAHPDRTPGLAELVLLPAGSCTAVLGAVPIAPVLPQMSKELAGVVVPLVLTVPALMIGILALFAGMIVDALDRKRLLLAAGVALGRAAAACPTTVVNSLLTS